MFANAALAVGLLLLYANPRFPPAEGAGVDPPPFLYTVNRLEPPHVSAELPLQAMLQPDEVAAPPFAIELPHPAID